jgi:hypothetical protein
MWHITGNSTVGVTELSWRKRNEPGAEEGFTVRFAFAATNNNDHAKMMPLAYEFIRHHSPRWITPADDRWEIDLDHVREEIIGDESVDWARGTRAVVPEFNFEPNDPGRRSGLHSRPAPRYTVWVVLTIHKET